MYQYLTDFHDLSAYFVIFILMWMTFSSLFRITILAFQQGKIESLKILNDRK